MPWVTKSTEVPRSWRHALSLATVACCRAGSKDNSGSSARMSSGSLARAWAWRMSCCCPPESWPTRRSAMPVAPTSARSSLTRPRAGFRFRSTPWARDSDTRSRARRGRSWGNILCCGIKPTRQLTSTLPAVSWRVPKIVPRSVDLPTPLGPKTAMNSPRSTARFMSDHSGSTAAFLKEMSTYTASSALTTSS